MDHMERILLFLAICRHETEIITNFDYLSITELKLIIFCCFICSTLLVGESYDYNIWYLSLLLLCTSLN